MCRNGLIHEDDVGCSKLTVFVKKDLELQDPIEILTIHQVEIRSDEIFICHR